MDEDQLFLNFEKRYFYELSRKDQIYLRLNIPLLVIISISGFYAVIVATDRNYLEAYGLVWFWVILSVSIITMSIGVYFFIKALLGKKDDMLPLPRDIEKWRQDLIKHHSSEKNALNKISAQLRSKMFRDYIDCTSTITTNNEARAFNLHYCNMFLVLSAIVAVIAYTLLIFPA